MLINTRDGSFTFYSLEYGEAYKTKSLGAYTESRRKFFETGELHHKIFQKEISILDICLGIGMNLAVTLEEYVKSGSKNRLHIVSVEKDASLLNIINSCIFLFPIEGYKILRQLLQNGQWNNITLELYITDARNFVEVLSGKFDVIYFDPFSQKHNPEMWSEAVFIKMRKLLYFNGCLMTYASSAPLRNMLSSLGFSLTLIPSIAGRKHPSLKAEIK